jgi:hypothetical protein
LLLRAEFGQKKRFGQHTLRRNNFQKNSCNYPNRLNLLDWTAYGTGRSNFFTKKSCLDKLHFLGGLYRTDTHDLARVREHSNVLTEGLSARRSQTGLIRPALPGEAI